MAGLIKLLPLLKIVQRFKTGWRIKIYTKIHPDGLIEYKSVNNYFKRLSRGIRYIQGKEGVENE